MRAEDPDQGLGLREPVTGIKDWGYMSVEDPDQGLGLGRGLGSKTGLI